MGLIKKLLVGLAAFTAVSAYPSAVIFNGSEVKALKSTIDINGGAKVLSSATDPTSSAVSAPIGSILLNTTNGNVYRKLDAGSSTNWSLIGNSASAAGNLLPNPGWETVTTGYTASGGTYTRTTTAANVASGIGAGSWDSNGAAQTLLSGSLTIPAGAYGQNGVVSCKLKCDTGTCTHTLTADDGTNHLASAQAITSSTSQYPRTSVNFIFPSSGSVRLKLASVAADEPTVYIDDCYLGLADGFNLQSISQAEIYGTLSYAKTASCVWSKTTTGTFAADTDCPTATVTGNASAPTTKVPGIRFANGLPPGRYELWSAGAFYCQRSSTSCLFEVNMTDGASAVTKSSTIAHAFTDTAGVIEANGSTLIGSFELGTAQGDTTIQANIVSLSAATTTATINGDTSATTFVLKRFPTSGETAYRPDLTNWKVDANLAGANFTLGTSNQATYVGMTNAGITLTNNAGSGNLTAQVACSTTNPPTGTTCSAGTEDNGISFVLPTAGDIEVCVYGGHIADVGSAAAPGSLDAAFTIVETPINAQTVTQTGKTKFPSGMEDASAVNTRILGTHPVGFCDIFPMASAGQKAFRLFYEQSVSGTVNGSSFIADGSASVGQRDVRWTVRPINQPVPAPILVGSVASNSPGSTKQLSAILNCDAGSTITSQSGTTSDGVATIGNISTGVCAGTFAGMWSGTAGLSCVANAKGSTLDQNARIDATSAAAFNLYCITPSTGAAAASCDASVICTGPR
jgi:hypothetical protein